MLRKITSTTNKMPFDESYDINLNLEYKPRIDAATHIQIAIDAVRSKDYDLLEIILEDNLVYDRQRNDLYEQSRCEVRFKRVLYGFHTTFVEHQADVLEGIANNPSIEFVPDAVRSNIYAWAKDVIENGIQGAKEDLEKTEGGFWKGKYKFSLKENKRYVGYYLHLLRKSMYAIIDNEIFTIGSKREIKVYVELLRQQFTKIMAQSDKLADDEEADALNRGEKMEEALKKISAADKAKETAFRALLTTKLSQLPPEYRDAAIKCPEASVLFKEIVQLRMSVNVCDSEHQMTLIQIAMHAAIENERNGNIEKFDMVYYLLNKYASPFIKDDLGNSAITLAIKRYSSFDEATAMADTLLPNMMNIVKNWYFGRLIPIEIFNTEDNQIKRVIRQFYKAKKNLDNYADIRLIVKMQAGRWGRIGYSNLSLRLKEWDLFYQHLLQFVSVADITSVERIAKEIAQKSIGGSSDLHTNFIEAISSECYDIMRLSLARESIIIAQSQRDLMSKSSELHGQLFLARQEIMHQETLAIKASHEVVLVTEQRDHYKSALVLSEIERKKDREDHIRCQNVKDGMITSLIAALGNSQTQVAKLSQTHGLTTQGDHSTVKAEATPKLTRRNSALF